MRDDGKIFRQDGKTIVQIQGHSSLGSLPGVRCLDPEAEEEKRIYEKVFIKKKVYLPGEYDQAVSEQLKGKDIVVLGMNGYSGLSDELCAAWGVKPGGYEAACAAILRSTTKLLQAKFPGVDIRFAHGASDLGVDRAIIEVANGLNRPQLGHSCPHFMFYVEDDDIPVYVAKDQAAYSLAFISSLDILIAANGRIQSFEHDIDAAFKKLKHVIPVNVLRSISTNGGPPAVGPDGKINDAVAAFEQHVHLVSQHFGSLNYNSANMFPSLVEHVNVVVEHIGRQILSPDRAFAAF